MKTIEIKTLSDGEPNVDFIEDIGTNTEEGLRPIGRWSIAAFLNAAFFRRDPWVSPDKF